MLSCILLPTHRRRHVLKARDMSIIDFYDQALFTLYMESGKGDEKTSSQAPRGRESIVFADNVKDARRFFVPRAPDLATQMPTLVGAGFECCGAGYKVERQTFGYLGIELVSGGTGLLLLNDLEYRLEPGVVFVYGPSTPHHIRPAPETELRKYFLDCIFDQRILLLLQDMKLVPGTCFKLPRLSELPVILETIVATGLSFGELSGPICDALFLSFLEMTTLLRREIYPENDRAFQRFKVCRDYLCESFLSLKTLDQAAAALDIDVSYLCRLFARFEKVSPYRFLMDLKMRYAVTCFRNRETSIAQIAEQLGFSDQFQFSKAFKRSLGQPPSVFISTRMR